MPVRFLVVILVFFAACSRTPKASPIQTVAEPVAWRAAKLLPVEFVGSSVFRVWTRKIELLTNPHTGAPMQLIWFKEGSRNEKISRFASLNLTTGQVKTHPAVPGLEVWKVAPSGGKLYLGMNMPAHLLEFDPRTDTLKDLGQAFKSANTIASISVGPDGTIAMGGSQGGTEVSLYDPRTGQFTSLGSIGDRSTAYVYSLTHDRTHVYAVGRGAGPWYAYAIDRTTRAAQKIAQVPVDGYIDAKHGTIHVKRKFRDSNEPWAVHTVNSGRLGAPSSAAAAARPHRTPTVDADVLLDTRQSLDTGKILIHYRVKRGPWRKAEAPAGREEMQITRLLKWSPTTLIGASGPYGPLFTFDTLTAKTESLGIPADMNVYSLARSGSSLYVSGYPGTALAKVDPARPFTTPDSYPGAPGVPRSDLRANPYFVGRLGATLGSHHGVAMEAGADGRIYICGHRMRYLKGFSIGWYDPEKNAYGELPESNQLDHYQVSWMSPIDRGRRLAISTRVDEDAQKGGQAPREARVFIIDTATGRYESSFVPLPGEMTLGPIAEAAPGVLIGTATDSGRNANGPTIVYKYNLRTGSLLARRVYTGILCGVSSDSDLPRKGADFQTGPDGHIWTVYRLPYGNAPSLIVRINPANLDVLPVGTVPKQGLRFAFVGRDLYLTGETRLRRLKNIVPGQVTARGE